MTHTNTSGPAFPTPRYERGDMYSLGMTLRDYFAAKAMATVLAELWSQGQHESPIPPLAARFSYEVADAMLQARNA